MQIESIVQKIKEALQLEEETQRKRFYESDIPLKELRKEGVVIHPIKLTNKNFGYTDQPTINVSFHIPGGINKSYYSEGTPVALFLPTQKEVCNGQLLSISDNEAEVLLHSNDFPDWIDEKGLGIKRLPDDKSFKYMHGILKRIGTDDKKHLNQLFELIHGVKSFPEIEIEESAQKLNIDSQLNESQKEAVKNGLVDYPVQLIHGPPGTGKTTTIVALIQELRLRNKTVIASAPSNAAIDHLAKGLISKGLKVLRLGNTTKVNKAVWEHTPEGILSHDDYGKKLKRLRIRAEEFRKMAKQYKRNFGREDREQRKLLFKEVYAIKDEIKKLASYYLTSYLNDADVVLGTPVGLMDSLIRDKQFDVAILDEAGQCIEPLAWLVLDKANRAVLAGDHFQLPPTVISDEAAKKGLNISILEHGINNHIIQCLLKTQYRMTPEIAGFSSRFFYGNELISNAESNPASLLFYDTAGANFEEKREGSTRSISNPEELRIISENTEEWCKGSQTAVFISPYSSQVELAKSTLKEINISTIDSFQGQEAEVVILSLVRSNTDGKIGFLSDYRRMNVALTRAQRKLIVIGDSSTLAASDRFYKEFVEYTEEIGAYRSVFELMY